MIGRKPSETVTLHAGGMVVHPYRNDGGKTSPEWKLAHHVTATTVIIGWKAGSADHKSARSPGRSDRVPLQPTPKTPPGELTITVKHYPD